jgi:endo-1,4-beta-xylanase
VFSGAFVVGAAIAPQQLQAGNADLPVIERHFNSLTAENVMKPATLAPSAGSFDFSGADAIVNFAASTGRQVRGHTLLWHNQTPSYFFEGTPTTVRTRLEQYVSTVVTRYRGRIRSWDVVNEVVTDDDAASSPYRNSNWLNAAGSADFIEWAFRAARAADPDAKLFINDYSTEFSGKRGRLLQIVRNLLDKGVPIDGVGHQCHLNINTSASQVFDALRAVDNLGAGLENHVTELDISVYNDPGQCFASAVNCAPGFTGAPPASVVRTQAQLYRDLFQGFRNFRSLTSVTLWGVNDAQSWLNTFPVARTNFPLLFDRSRLPKPAFLAVADPNYTIP